MGPGISTSSCFSGAFLLFGAPRVGLAERDAPGCLRTAWRFPGCRNSTEATRSGATSAKCATDTLVKYVKGMGPALVLPLPGQGLWIYLKAAWPGRKGEEVSCLLASFFAKDDDCFGKIYCVRDEKRICGII